MRRLIMKTNEWRALALGVASVLTGCLGEGSEPTPLPTQVNAIDLVLTAQGDGAAAMLVRVTGVPLDSVVGIGVVAGLINNDQGSRIADLAIAGDVIANGVVARLFLAEARSPADITVTVTDVIGGESLDAIDPATQSLTFRASE
jgi:hypothetical protein